MPVEPRITLSTANNTINSNSYWGFEESSQSFIKLDPAANNIFGTKTTVPLLCPVCRRPWEATESNGYLYQQCGFVDTGFFSETLKTVQSRGRFNVQPCGHSVTQEWAAAYAAERLERNRGCGHQRIEGEVLHAMRQRRRYAWENCRVLIDWINRRTEQRQRDDRNLVVLHITMLLNEITLCGGSVTLESIIGEPVMPCVALWARNQIPGIWFPTHVPSAIQAIRENPVTTVLLDRNGLLIGATAEQVAAQEPHIMLVHRHDPERQILNLATQRAPNLDTVDFQPMRMGSWTPSPVTEDAEHARRQRERLAYLQTTADRIMEETRTRRITQPASIPPQQPKPGPTVITLTPEEINEEFFRSLERKPRRVKRLKPGEET